MTFTSRRRVAQSLMAGSMILLLCFLYFWLRQSYRMAYNELEQTTNTVFYAALQDARDSLNIRLFFNQIPQDSTIKDIEWHMSTISEEGGDHKLYNPKSPVKIRIKNWSDKEQIDTLEKDSINVIIATQSTTDIHTHTPGLADHSTTIRKEFNKEISEEGLKRAIKILTQKPNADLGDSLFIADIDFYSLLQKNISLVSDQYQFELFQLSQSLPDKSLMLSEIHTDIWTGETYQLSLLNHHSIVLKKISLHFFFALLLLLFISTAFAMIYRAWLQQQRLTEIKNDFISNITHELKTPITTVGVAIEALHSFDALKNPERTLEYLDISKHELDRLSILVDKILKMSLFEEGEPDLKIETLDLKSLIENVLASLRLVFEKYNAQVKLTVTGINHTIQADRVHLTNVIYNLIDNALKYSTSKPNIKVELNQSEQQLQMVVADSGIGIPKDYKDKVFEKFFRVPKGNAHNVKGYGLGLAYVNSVIQKHQGTIQVESKEGKGSRFVISLPV